MRTVLDDIVEWLSGCNGPGNVPVPGERRLSHHHTVLCIGMTGLKRDGQDKKAIRPEHLKIAHEIHQREEQIFYPLGNLQTGIWSGIEATEEDRRWITQVWRTQRKSRDRVLQTKLMERLNSKKRAVTLQPSLPEKSHNMFDLEEDDEDEDYTAVEAASDDGLLRVRTILDDIIEWLREYTGQGDVPLNTE